MVEEEEEEAEEVEEDVVVTKAASGSLVEMGTIVSVIESRYLKFEKKRVGRGVYKWCKIFFSRFPL